MREKIVFLIILQCLLGLSSILFAESPIEVIYWQASDVPRPTQEDLKNLNNVMREIQSFFASEMDRHGFGEKTFAFKDIKVVKGKHKMSYYNVHGAHWQNDGHWRIVKEYGLPWGWNNEIYVLFIGGVKTFVGSNAFMQPLCENIPSRLIECNSLVVVPTGILEIIRPLTAHEIGHAFNLEHPTNRFISDKVDVMYYPLHVIPGLMMTLKSFALSAKDARFLDNDGRLAIQQDSQVLDTDIVLDTDVNNDGYTDLSDCLIVRSAMSIESMYDTDINKDGVTNILDLMLVKAAAFEAIAAAAPFKQRVITTTWAALKQR